MTLLTILYKQAGLTWFNADAWSTQRYHHHHHHVPEGLGVFPVP